MSCPAVIRIVTPGPPGPGLTLTGPSLAGRASGTGGLVPIPLGPGISIVDGALTLAGAGSGTVTSVGLSVPTGFSVANSPITGSGTLGISLAIGYSLPTTAKQGQWDQAYADLGQARTPTVHGHAITDVSGLQTALGAKADLVSGLVPASQLPSFVDDVLEYANFTAFPVTGEPGKLYVSLATGRVYRWAGSAYIEIIGSPGSTDSIAEGSVNLFFTDARGQTSAASWWAGSAAKIKLDGLSNVATSGAYSDLSGRPDLSLKADLVNGLVPSSQLPGFVDDVVEFANLAAFPATGEAGKLYIALNTNKQYRWSGSTYQEINPSPGSTDAVPEGSVNLYHTTLRAAAAAPVQSVAGRTGNVNLAKGDVGLSNVDNTSDADKPVSTATATALAGKAATGAIGSSGLTMATARLLGRTTVGAGAVEEIQVAGGTFANGVLTLSGLPSTLTADANGNLTFTARWIQSTNGAASAPPMALTGTWFTGGTSTTTKPQLLIEPAGTTSASWSTAGTGLGVNAPSGFGGNFFDAQINGSRVHRLTTLGLDLGIGTQGSIQIYNGGSVASRLNISGLTIEAGSEIRFGFSSTASSTFLRDDAANTLAQRNGTNAQTSRIYNTFTNDTNYERGRLEWNGNEFRIGTEALGTGTLRSLGLYSGNTRYQIIGSNFNQFDKDIFMNACNIVTGGNGFKIGTATTQKFAFWNATPVAQPAAVADATDAASVITQLNLALARLRTLGLIAT